MNDKLNKHDNAVPSVPVQKSETGFLIEGLDRLDVADKPYHVERVGLFNVACRWCEVFIKRKL